MRTGRIVLVVLVFAVLVVGVAEGENGRSTTAGNSVYLPVIYKNYPPPTEPYLLTKIALPAGSHPHGIALDPDGQRAFVGNHLGNSLTVIDTATNAVLGTVSLPGAGGPNGVAYHAGTDRVFVANRNSDNVSVVDPTSLQFVQNISVGNEPDGVAVQDNWVYVANWGSGTVTVLDALTQSVHSTWNVGPQPALIAGNDERGFVYVAGYGSNSIRYLKDGQTYNNRPNVPTPYGLTFDPITFRVYAASRGMNRLTLVDVNPNWVVGNIDTGGEVYIAGVNPRTGHVFAGLGDRVQVYDRRDNALLTTIPIGGESEEGIAVDPQRNLVYVTSGGANEVVVIQDVPTYDIAYVTWLQNVGHLRLMEDGGEHGRVLAGPDVAFTYPDWDPAGKHLAYSGNSYTRNEYDIYRIEAGGQNHINLTRDDTGTRDERPLWSPDGSQIAWIRDDALWVMDEYGYTKTQLTPAGMTVHELDWSPDGTWIVIAAHNAGETYDDLYLVPAAGGTPVQLTFDPANDSGPDFAPNGNQIVFHSDRSGNADVYLLNVSDLDHVQTLPLTTDPATDYSAVFSHDGSRIAFISYQDNCDGPCVFIMNADGSNPHNLTGDDVDFLTPLRWSPDDRWLATHTLGGAFSTSQVIKINTTTGEVVWLTDNVSSNLWPTWRPDTWR